MASRRDKIRFVRLEYDGARFVVPPDEAQIILDTDAPAEYKVTPVWMTQAEFDALPEFQGF
jgi:hypothetical protein